MWIKEKRLLLNATKQDITCNRESRSPCTKRIEWNKCKEKTHNSRFVEFFLYTIFWFSDFWLSMLLCTWSWVRNHPNVIWSNVTVDNFCRNILVFFWHDNMTGIHFNKAIFSLKEIIQFLANFSAQQTAHNLAHI